MPRGPRPARTPVAVREPIDPLRTGLEEALVAAGHRTSTVVRLDDLRSVDARCAVCSVGDAEVHALAQVAAARPELAIVVLREEASAITPTTMLASGAQCVLPRGAAPRAVVLTVELALLGHAVVPVVARPVGTTVLHALTGDERGWLASLATASSLIEIARACGFSEREMHRRLRRLYQKLGVSSRLEAALLASHWGLVP